MTPDNEKILKHLGYEQREDVGCGCHGWVHKDTGETLFDADFLTDIKCAEILLKRMVKDGFHVIVDCYKGDPIYAVAVSLNSRSWTEYEDTLYEAIAKAYMKVKGI